MNAISVRFDAAPLRAACIHDKLFYEAKDLPSLLNESRKRQNSSRSINLAEEIDLCILYGVQRNNFRESGINPNQESQHGYRAGCVDTTTLHNSAALGGKSIIR